MDADLKKIKKLTQLMKKEGLLELKGSDFHLKLSPQALFPEKKTQKESETPAPSSESEFTEEQTLLWSSPLLTQMEVAGEG